MPALASALELLHLGLDAVLRRRRKGREGYLLMRRSRLGRFPHFLYAEIRRTGTMRMVSFKPLDPREKKVPPPLFRGALRWGDFEDTRPLSG